MYEDLKGKVAIITGVRMGRSHALKLAEARAKVVYFFSIRCFLLHNLTLMS